MYPVHVLYLQHSIIRTLSPICYMIILSRRIHSSVLYTLRHILPQSMPYLCLTLDLALFIPYLRPCPTCTLPQTLHLALLIPYLTLPYVYLTLDFALRTPYLTAYLTYTFLQTLPYSYRTSDLALNFALRVPYPSFGGCLQPLREIIPVDGLVHQTLMLINISYALYCVYCV